jgi:hypothetical protein
VGGCTGDAKRQQIENEQVRKDSDPFEWPKTTTHGRVAAMAGPDRPAVALRAKPKAAIDAMDGAI